MVSDYLVHQLTLFCKLYPYLVFWMYQRVPEGGVGTYFFLRLHHTWDNYLTPVVFVLCPTVGAI